MRPPCPSFPAPTSCATAFPRRCRSRRCSSPRSPASWPSIWAVQQRSRRRPPAGPGGPAGARRAVPAPPGDRLPGLRPGDRGRSPHAVPPRGCRHGTAGVGRPGATGRRLGAETPAAGTGCAGRRSRPDRRGRSARDPLGGGHGWPVGPESTSRPLRPSAIAPLPWPARAPRTARLVPAARPARQRSPASPACGSRPGRRAQR
jgi:hypothetical protein